MTRGYAISPWRVLRVAILAVCSCFVALTTVADDSATGYYEDARRRFAAGEAEAALVQLKNALREDDQHIPSLLLWGEVQLELGDPATAGTAFSDALLLGADPGTAVLGLAEAYLAQGLYRRILTELKPSQLQGSGRADLLGYFAIAQRNLGDDRQSEQSLARALAVDGNARVPNMARAEQLLASGDAADAGEIVDFLLERFPRDARLWSLRATVLVELGDAPAAIEALTRALELNPRLTRARIARAGLHLADGNLEAVSEDVDLVRRNSPGDPRGAFLKARLLELEGQAADAIELYQLCANIISTLDAEQLARDQQLTAMATLANAKAGVDENAIKLLSAYQSSHSDDAITGAMLSEMLLSEGKGADALSVLKPLLFNDPESVGLQVLQARALSTEDRHREAISVWQRLTTEDGNDIEIDARFAFDLIAAGELKEGIDRFESVVLRDSSRIKDRYFLAQAHMSSGNYARAVELARTLVEEQPEDVGFAELLGRSRFSSGDLSRARTDLEAAVRRFPESVPLGVTLAEVQIAQGELEQARERLAALDQQQPSNVAVLIQRARVERLAGDFAQSRKLAEEAIMADRSALVPRSLLVAVLLDLGDRQAALETARIAARRLPESPAVEFLYADTLATVGETSRALAQYKLIARRGDLDHTDLFRAARAQLRLGAPQDASASLYRARLRQPDSLLYATAAVDVALRLGDFDSALNEANTLIGNYPDEPSPQLLAGRALWSLGKQSEALEYFERAAKLDPGDRRIVLRVVQALMEAGQADRAKALLSEWLGVHPGDVAVQFVFSDLLVQESQWEEAVTLLEALMAQQPDNPELLNRLAYAQLQTDSPDALVNARRAHALAPQSAGINDTLGFVLVKQNQPAEGLPFLREAVARRANDATLRYHLGVALNALGRHQEAGSELRAALRLSEDFRERSAAEALLRELDRT